MTTIVKHKRTGNEYILLGINGEGQKATPSRFLSEMFTQEKSETSCLATLCDVKGNIFLAYIDELIVTQISGKKPTEILPEPVISSVPNNYYQQKEADFDDELEAEEFDKDEQKLATKSPKTSPTYSETKSQDGKIGSNSDFEDDEDWI
jgi:hypothetical protein